MVSGRLAGSRRRRTPRDITFLRRRNFGARRLGRQRAGHLPHTADGGDRGREFSHHDGARQRRSRRDGRNVFAAASGAEGQQQRGGGAEGGTGSAHQSKVCHTAIRGFCGFQQLLAALTAGSWQLFLVTKVNLLQRLL